MRLFFHGLLERAGEVWWGIFLKLDAQGQEGKNISEVDGQGLGGFEN